MIHGEPLVGIPRKLTNLLPLRSKAGLITVSRGTGGAALAKDVSDITLYDIYEALEPDGLSSIIGVHDCHDRACPVAQNIAYVLRRPYELIENSIRDTMKSITLSELLDRFHEKVTPDKRA